MLFAKEIFVTVKVAEAACSNNRGSGCLSGEVSAWLTLYMEEKPEGIALSEMPHGLVAALIGSGAVPVPADIAEFPRYVRMRALHKAEVALLRVLRLEDAETVAAFKGCGALKEVAEILAT